MRKFTALFVFLCAALATFAQGGWEISESPLTAIPSGEDDFVVLKEPSSSITGWSSNGYLNSGANDVIAEVNSSAIYQFVKVDTKSEDEQTFDVYVLKNVKNGQYLRGNNDYVDTQDAAFKFTARPATYKTLSDDASWIDYSDAVTLEKAEGQLENHWVFCSNTGKSYLGFYNNPSIMSYTDTNFWLVYRATRTSENLINVTFHYTTSDGFEFTKEEIDLSVPYTPEPPALDFYTITGFDNTELNESATVEVTCTPDFPFEFATVSNGAFADGTKWYTLYTRGNTNNVVYADGENMKVGNVGRGAVASKLFAFERVNGEAYKFRVYCMEKGTESPLAVANFNGDTPGIWGGEGTNVFRLSKNNNGFALANDGNAALDHNTSNGLMAVWGGSATGAGGQINAVSADDLIKGLADSGNPNLVGGTTAPANLVSAIESYNANPVEANLEAMAKANVNREERTVEADKVYQIIYTRGNVAWTNSAAYADADGVVSEAADSRHVFTSEPDATTPEASNLWTIVSADGGYKFRTLNSQFYLGNIDGEKLVTTKEEKWGKTYAIERNDANPTVWAIKDPSIEGAENYLNSYYNPGNNGSHEICYWRGGVGDTGNTVVIKEINEVPVTITAAGWATLCFPRALAIPTGVNAYYVTSVEDGGIYVEELTETIPAGTPVILSGAATKYNFGFADAATDAVSGNKLIGTTVQRTGVTEGDFYGLKSTADGAAFVPYNTTTVPANKALLPATEIPASAAATQALLIRFGNTATAIGHVPAAEARKADVYYDLNGRVVAYPTAGIYLTADGRKVFIK